MSFVSVLHSLLRPSGTTSRARRPRPRKVAPRSSFRPGLEALEVRNLLSAAPIVVTSLADSGLGTLRAAIMRADGDPSNGYIIDFGVTGAINLTSALPDLSNNITIQGPGAGNLTVRRDDSGEFSIFAVDAGANVSIADLTIANGASGFGGGIENSGTVKVTDCNLTDNFGGDNGGGIDNNAGTLVVTGCNFDGNATQPSGAGGILNRSGTATVTNSTLTNSSGSGIATSGGTVAVTGCDLDGNVGERGGGIDIFSGTATVTNCTLTGNSASDTGGGIYNSYAGAATVTNCTLTDNSASTDGGGIDNVGHATVTNCTLTGNASSGDGGGVYNDYNGTATVTGCTLTGNTASAAGGGMFNNGGTVTVTNCTLIGNSAAGSGGGIDNDLGTATVTGCTLTNNSADFGGGIGCQAFGSFPTRLTVTGCTLTSNSAASSGGGIENDFGTATVTGCTLASNSAIGGSGGGIDTIGTVTVTNCNFSGDSAGVSGGGIENFGAATVSGCAFIGNSASSEDGGGVFNDGTATVTNCILSNNSAPLGGGVYNDGTATVANCNLNNNSAAGNGGGITTDGGTTTIAGCILTGDSANFGGGVFIFGGTATVTGCDLDGNTASQGAGGLYNFGGTTTLTNCTLANNSTTYGGGVFNNGGALTLTNCTVADNSASVNGGGVFNNAAGTVTANNTIVAANHAPVGPDFSGTLAAASAYNLIGDGTAMTGVSNGAQGNQVGTTASPINPLLGALQINGGTTPTLALLPGSPAIDAGGNALAVDANGIPLAADQRGVARIVNGTVDIGAFESRPFTLAISSGGVQSTTVNTGFLNPLVVTVTSAYGDPVQGGVVTFSAPANGASATFPASGGALMTATIDPAGHAAVAVTADTTAGGYAVTASSRGASFPAGFSLTNTPGAARTFAVSGFPSPTIAGVAHTVIVTAKDQYGNTATGYAGVVSISSSDPQATLPSYALLTNGVGLFGVTLKTAGAQSITATDAMTAALTGVQSGITVGPSTAVAFHLTAPATVARGAAFTVTVTAVDAYGNVAIGYLGTVEFFIRDANGFLFTQYTFTAADGGVHAFTGLKLRNKGRQTISVFDMAHKTILGSFTINGT